MPSLDSALAKFSWAQGYLQTLDAEITAFLERGPYPVTVKPDDKTGKRTIHVAIREKPPAQRWALMTGDIVHNLRSSLDHVVHDLSNRIRGTAFPIFDNRDKYAALDGNGQPSQSSGLWKVRGLTQAHQALVESLQPYHAGDASHLEPLWVLHDLDIVDKHRLLLVLDEILEGSSVIAYTFGADMPEVRIEHGTFEDGAQIGCYTVTPPDAEVNMDFGVAFDVTLDPSPLGYTLRDTLRMLVGATENVLFRFRTT